MIQNLADALAPLKSLQRNALEAKQRAEFTVANRIAEQARAHAPGSLGSKISVIQTGEETIIDGGDELSAYVEFGTGNANVTANLIEFGSDPDMVAEAAKFFVSGKGTLASQPFFFPAIFENRDELFPELEKELNNEAES